MVAAPYEVLLHQAGLGLAVEPLRQWFAAERLDDPRLQLELAAAVIGQTQQALAMFARPHTVH